MPLWLRSLLVSLTTGVAQELVVERIPVVGIVGVMTGRATLDRYSDLLAAEVVEVQKEVRSPVVGNYHGDLGRSMMRKATGHC